MRLLSYSLFSRTLPILFCTLLIGNGSLIAQTINQSTPVSISQAQFDFEAANTLLAEGQYKEALKKYGAIREMGLYSGGLFVNMAIAAVELDSLGLAKYYLQKALLDESTESAAATGLMYVETQFSRQSATLPPLPWEQFFDFLETNVGASAIYWISFGCILLSTLLLLMSWFVGAWTEGSTRKITFIGVGVGLLLLALSLFIDQRATRFQDAVIVVNEATVYSEADVDASAVAVGYEGYDCRVDFSETSPNDWVYIRLGNGQMGWIQQSTLRIH
jgi:hypothetical protein